MKTFIIVNILLVFNYYVIAQDAVYAKLNEAKGSFTAGNLEDTRYALQQAIAELDVLVGREILNILPKQVSGLGYIESEDFIAGSAMEITGSSVQRNYKDEEKYIIFNLMNNSPMLSAVTSFLTNPLFANMSDGNQKQLKISGYKAVLQKNSEDAAAYTLQIPLNQSLLMLEFNKFNEQEAIKAAENFNITTIAEIVN